MVCLWSCFTKKKSLDIWNRRHFRKKYICKDYQMFYSGHHILPSFKYKDLVIKWKYSLRYVECVSAYNVAMNHSDSCQYWLSLATSENGDQQPTRPYEKQTTLAQICDHAFSEKRLKTGSRAMAEYEGGIPGVVKPNYPPPYEPAPPPQVSNKTFVI